MLKNIVLLLMITSSPCWATYSMLQWTDCGSDPNFHIVRLAISPMPLHFPGDIQLSVQGYINRTLGDFSIHHDVKKRSSLMNMLVPYLLRAGSHSYDQTCAKSLLDTMITENWAGISGSIGQQVKDMFASHGLANIPCPIPPMQLNIQDYTLHLPPIPAVFKLLAAGDYSAKITVNEHGTNHVLVCVNLHMTVQ